MFIFAEQIVPSDECLHGDDSSSGPANPDLVTQPGLGLHSYQSSELQFAEQVQQVQVPMGGASPSRLWIRASGVGEACSARTRPS